MVPSRTIVSAPSSSLLVSLQDVKAELGFSDSAADGLLSRYITWASARISQYCGRDSFGAQTVRDRWDLQRYTDPLLLTLRPVTAVLSVTEDGEALAASEWRLDNQRMLQRREGGDDVLWPATVVEVTYTGGYALPAGADPVLADAALQLVKARWLMRDRDPAIRSERVDGVGSVAYLDPQPGSAGLPIEVAQALTNFRSWAFG